MVHDSNESSSRRLFTLEAGQLEVKKSLERFSALLGEGKIMRNASFEKLHDPMGPKAVIISGTTAVPTVKRSVSAPRASPSRASKSPGRSPTKIFPPSRAAPG